MCVTREGKPTPGGEADVVCACACVHVCRRQLGGTVRGVLAGRCSGITELKGYQGSRDTSFYKRGGVEIQKR